jgi:hypothetical protein
MKFLVIVEAVPGVLMAPEQSLALSKEMWAWSRRLVEAGRSDVAYGLADHAGGLMGGFGIANVKSLEELAENLGTCPGAGIATMKVYPLVAPEVAEKLIEGGLAQLAKKKK